MQNNTHLVKLQKLQEMFDDEVLSVSMRTFPDGKKIVFVIYRDGSYDFIPC